MESNSTAKMATLSEAINRAVKQGYTENFKFLLIGLTTEAEEKYYSRADISITNFFRFEGYSDSQENAILYLIETSDSKKGILLDAHSNFSDARISAFINQENANFTVEPPNNTPQPPVLSLFA